MTPEALFGGGKRRPAAVVGCVTPGGIQEEGNREGWGHHLPAEVSEFLVNSLESHGEKDVM